MTQETKIFHWHGGLDRGAYPNLKDYKMLCFGHDDSRLTGGSFYYIGDIVEAQAMADERMARARRNSDSYYSQPWV